MREAAFHFFDFLNLAARYAIQAVRHTSSLLRIAILFHFLFLTKAASAGKSAKMKKGRLELLRDTGC